MSRDLASFERELTGSGNWRDAFKPIMHHGGIFYVLDGDVRYEFKVEAQSDVEEESHEKATVR